MVIIERRSLVPFILKINEDQPGIIFTVKFIKRTNNEDRTMNCRLGVYKYVKGTAEPGSISYLDNKELVEEYDLLRVYDVNKLDNSFNQEWNKTTKGAYRSISVDTVYYLKIGGQEYEVVD